MLAITYTKIIKKGSQMGHTKKIYQKEKKERERKTRAVV
jgi:hypothetical protein